MKKSKRITVTKKYVDELKEQVQCLTNEIVTVRADREKHRSFYISILKDTLKILGEGKAVNSEWLSKRLAQHLNNVDSWYWS